MNAVDRKMTLDSRRISRLCVAVVLKDEAKPDKRPEGDVFLMVAGVTIQPVLNGVYPIVNKPETQFSITIGGSLYLEETTLVDVSGLDPKAPFKEIALTPMASVTIMKGRILDITNNAPVAGAKVTIKTMTENAITGADGVFSIIFKGLAADLKVTLSIKTDIFKSKQTTVEIRKQTTTVIPDIKLTRK